MVGEVIKKRSSRDKLFKKFKKTRLHIDRELYIKKTKFTAKLLTAKRIVSLPEMSARENGVLKFSFI